MADKKLGEVRAFEVWYIHQPEWRKTVYHRTASKARYDYFLDVHESYPDVEYMDFRSRCIGKPITPADFARTAEYRNVPFAKIGMRVLVDDKPGIIVGKNSSANFDVLFEDGWVGNCHPNWKMRFLNECGEEIPTTVQGEL